MKPAPFEYLDPRSVPETVALLAEHGDEAKILAGGQSLVPLLNMRLTRFNYLIDIARVPELWEFHAEDGALTIGAGVQQYKAEESETVAREHPLLAEAIRYVGHPQTRSRGTIGGSIAHADPAAELPAVAVALGATMRAAGPNGARDIPAEEFFVGYFTTSLEPDEMLTHVALPPWPANTGHAFLEVSRRHGDFAIAGIAAVVGLDESGAITRADLVLCGCADTPVRAHEAEEAIRGKRPNDALYAAAAQRASAEVDPPGDIHAPAEYRKRVASVLVERALRTAVERATTGGAS